MASEKQTNPSRKEYPREKSALTKIVNGLNFKAFMIGVEDEERGLYEETLRPFLFGQLDKWYKWSNWSENWKTICFVPLNHLDQCRLDPG